VFFGKGVNNNTKRAVTQKKLLGQLLFDSDVATIDKATAAPMAIFFLPVDFLGTCFGHGLWFISISSPRSSEARSGPPCGADRA
jgi:hypothetical protein